MINKTKCNWNCKEIKSFQRNTVIHILFYFKTPMKMRQTSARNVARQCCRLVRIAILFDIISDAECERYWIGDPSPPSLLISWYVPLKKARGPLSKIMKYIFCELVPWNTEKLKYGKQKILRPTEQLSRDYFNPLQEISQSENENGSHLSPYPPK